jgi:hypothetical protein
MSLDYETPEEQDARHESQWQQFLAEMAAKGIPVCADCHRLLDDDVCPACAWASPPEFLAAAGRVEDFEYAAVDGIPVGAEVEPAGRDRLIVALYERLKVQVERDAKTAPNGCAACGIVEREHGKRWTRGVNFHIWIAPTDEVRLGRMLARRNPGWQAWREINRRFYLRLPNIVATDGAA